MSEMPPEPARADVDKATIAVVSRFVLRLIILAASALFGAKEFGRTFSTLLVLGALYCACAAAFRREQPFARTLTHWDEAVAYAVLGRLAWALG